MMKKPKPKADDSGEWRKVVERTLDEHTKRLDGLEQEQKASKEDRLWMRETLMRIAGDVHALHEPFTVMRQRSERAELDLGNVLQALRDITNKLEGRPCVVMGVCPVPSSGPVEG